MVHYSFTFMETRRIVRMNSPGRPPRLSHSPGTMMLLYVHKDPKDCLGRGTQDVHLDFHTAPDLYRASHSLKLIKALTIKLVNMVINVHRNRKAY